MAQEFITIIEAARRCGVSDKTIRRAIHAGKLPARYPKPNVAQISVFDLEAWRVLQGNVYENQIIALEQRIELLELQMTLLVKNNLLAPKRSRRQKNKKRARTGLLPSDLVSLVDFATQHALSEPRVLMALEVDLLPVIRGEWTSEEGTPITLALDANGRATFYQLYRDACIFVECEECPHDE